MEKIVLSNGYEIPPICFGTDIVSSSFFDDSKNKMLIKNTIKKILGKDTRKYEKDKGIIKCVGAAMKEGCVFFDTSRAYDGSELMLKHMLKGYNRKDYYLCTKLRNSDQLKRIPAVDCLKDSMTRLGVDYVDLYLLHWPVEETYLDYWNQLEQLYKSGLAKAIGVSNCKIHHLEALCKASDIIPMVNEVELHPLLSEEELRQYCKLHNIQVMAYSSTARLDFRLQTSKRMRQVCRETKKDLAQIILRWHIQNGVIPIFNTSSINHLKSNIDIFDFALSEEQMKIIDSVNINARTRYDSDNCEWDML